MFYCTFKSPSFTDRDIKHESESTNLVLVFIDSIEHDNSVTLVLEYRLPEVFHITFRWRFSHDEGIALLVTLLRDKNVKASINE